MKRAQLSFEMKITSTHQVGAAWIAFYKGHPRDAAWFEEDRLVVRIVRCGAKI